MPGFEDGGAMSLGKAGVHARRQTLAHAAPETHAEEGLHLVTKTHAMQTPVLVLNASYEPINICGARRALAGSRIVFANLAP